MNAKSTLILITLPALLMVLLRLAPDDWQLLMERPIAWGCSLWFLWFGVVSFRAYRGLGSVAASSGTPDQSGGDLIAFLAALSTFFGGFVLNVTFALAWTPPFGGRVLLACVITWVLLTLLLWLWASQRNKNREWAARFAADRQRQEEEQATNKD